MFSFKQKKILVYTGVSVSLFFFSISFGFVVKRFVQFRSRHFAKSSQRMNSYFTWWSQIEGDISNYFGQVMSRNSRTFAFAAKYSIMDVCLNRNKIPKQSFLIKVDISNNTTDNFSRFKNRNIQKNVEIYGK